MTRERHVVFDETNILLTNQPRARTEGHLFQPEPPTPVPLSACSSPLPKERALATQSEFNAARDAHYANEYQHIQRANREVETSTNVKGPGTEQDTDDSVVVDYQMPDDDDDNAGA
ncbi:Protein C35D10.8 [Aphelenchoides avenae]|nr:Protein C35D10.8 [Aphelenchus avenae]